MNKNAKRARNTVFPIAMSLAMVIGILPMSMTANEDGSVVEKSTFGTMATPTDSESFTDDEKDRLLVGSVVDAFLTYGENDETAKAMYDALSDELKALVDASLEIEYGKDGNNNGVVGDGIGADDTIIKDEVLKTESNDLNFSIDDLQTETAKNWYLTIIEYLNWNPKEHTDTENSKFYRGYVGNFDYYSYVYDYEIEDIDKEILKLLGIYEKYHNCLNEVAIYYAMLPLQGYLDNFTMEVYLSLDKEIRKYADYLVDYSVIYYLTDENVKNQINIIQKAKNESKPILDLEVANEMVKELAQYADLDILYGLTFEERNDVVEKIKDLYYHVRDNLKGNTANLDDLETYNKLDRIRSTIFDIEYQIEDGISKWESGILYSYDRANGLLNRYNDKLEEDEKSYLDRICFIEWYIQLLNDKGTDPGFGNGLQLDKELRLKYFNAFTIVYEINQLGDDYSDIVKVMELKSDYDVLEEEVKAYVTGYISNFEAFEEACENISKIPENVLKLQQLISELKGEANYTIKENEEEFKTKVQELLDTYNLLTEEEKLLVPEGTDILIERLIQATNGYQWKAGESYYDSVNVDIAETSEDIDVEMVKLESGVGVHNYVVNVVIPEGYSKDSIQLKESLRERFNAIKLKINGNDIEVEELFGDVDLHDVLNISFNIINNSSNDYQLVEDSFKVSTIKNQSVDGASVIGFDGNQINIETSGIRRFVSGEEHFLYGNNQEYIPSNDQKTMNDHGYASDLSIAAFFTDYYNDEYSTTFENASQFSTDILREISMFNSMAQYNSVYFETDPELVSMWYNYFYNFGFRLTIGEDEKSLGDWMRTSMELSPTVIKANDSTSTAVPALTFSFEGEAINNTFAGYRFGAMFGFALEKVEEETPPTPPVDPRPDPTPDPEPEEPEEEIEEEETPETGGEEEIEEETTPEVGGDEEEIEEEATPEVGNKDEVTDTGVASTLPWLFGLMTSAIVAVAELFRRKK